MPAKEGASLAKPVGGEASHALEVDCEALARLRTKKFGSVSSGAISVDEPGADGAAKLVLGDDLGNVDAEDGGVDGSVEVAEVEVLVLGLLLLVELDGGLQGTLGEVGDGRADGRVNMGSELRAKFFEGVGVARGRVRGPIIMSFSSPPLLPREAMTSTRISR